MPRLARIFSSSLLALTASFFIGSTMLGAIRDYCSVPYWDMWDSYIQFYEKVSKGDLYFWWEPHMEHRILIPRIFFWLDIKYFHGLSLLLIPLNLTLIGMLWVVLLSGTLFMFKARLSKTGLWNAVWLLAIVCFSWMQRENIINGFQNVFFLALLLPLLAFQCLSIAHLRSHSRMWFGLALFFAFASVGTLASGVLAPPLMVLLAIIQGQSRIRIAILVGVSILAFAVYHIGTPTFPLLDSSLRTKPDALAQFFLVYLGGPLRVITNDYLVAAIAGAAFVAGSVLCFWCVVTRREGHPMFLAFTAFVAYVLATALATTMGRAVLGIVGTT
ncbi:MAG: hypothetical protein JO076_03260, partial [Verrucomicrobia bacterium]|nr:hypothetical protein [Verrucomicrobiota bacterium]